MLSTWPSGSHLNVKISSLLVFKRQGGHSIFVERKLAITIMRKAELTPTQLRDVNIFNLILDYHGWADFENTEKRFDANELVNPEGYRVTHHHHTTLEVRYHAPVNMISLKINDINLDDEVQFHFLFDDRPERILEWMVEVSDSLNLETYPELLKEADGKCEMILLEVSDTEIYEVKPPTSV